MPRSNYPYIPDSITVHLGAPDAAAENVTVPFIDYVKNVASSEIYPTWPENSLRANIYAITTYALNRIYTEWYPSRGYDFDITSVTRFDQAFVPDRDVFENISRIVDDTFNDYVVKQGSVQPLFTQFCNGTTSTCPGLSQWGTVELAEQGLTPYEILQRYYGDDINIIQNAPVQEITSTYPGSPVRLGDAGNEVKIIQEELNRISRNYPYITRIPEADGIFRISTETAVRQFQEVFDLPQTGEVDKATWYKIKLYYVGVKNLSDLISEGISPQEAQLPYLSQLTEGVQGIQVRIVQYYLNFISYFNTELNEVPLDGIYGPRTVEAVREFQQYYGVPVTGIVNLETWDVMQNIYSDIIASLPEGYEAGRAKFYPGYFLSEGMRGQDVTDLQTYLSLIADYYNDIPKIPVTGYYGTQTRDAVLTFQRLFGLPINGAVGPVTWDTIAEQYNFILDSENL